MKKILFLQLIFAGIVLHAQNYNPIFLNGPVHFESEQGYMVPYRIDSTLVTDSSVVYKSFDIIRPLDNGVFTLKGASWIGQKIEKFDDGRWLFYNHAGLPVTLNCKKENGESWEMFRYDSVTFLVANVDSTAETHFLGIIDSIKYIKMQWVDPNNVIPYDFEEPLKLSKNHGFVNVLDFYSFPFTEVVQHFITGNYISQIMNLAGIEGGMDLGFSNLTTTDLFNISIGNIFHVRSTKESHEYQDCEYGSWINRFIDIENIGETITAKIER